MYLFGTWLRPNERTAQRQGYRFVLSMILSGLAIALLYNAHSKQSHLFIEKIRLLASLSSSISEGRLKVIEHHAVSGDWLDEAARIETEPCETDTAEVDEQRSRPMEARIGHFSQGAIHIAVYNRRGQSVVHEWWSIRPAVVDNEAPNVLWVCGSHPPPQGFRALGEDLTTIPPEENFKFCRKS
jgi:hypothetical protein